MEDYEVFWSSKHMSSRAIQLTHFGGTFNCMYPENYQLIVQHNVIFFVVDTRYLTQ